MANVTIENSFLQYLLNEFNVPTKKGILFCDNQTTIHFSINLVFHKRIKHIEFDCHFVREKLEKRFLTLKYVRTKSQPTEM